MRFWPFGGKVPVEQLTAEQLQQRLVEAAYSSPRHLRRFCEAYRQQIETNVESLIKAPAGLDVEDAAAMNRFIQGLAMAAQCLANECGSPALWKALSGDRDDNPIIRWENFLHELPARMQRLEHEALLRELQVLIEEVKDFRGDAARQHEAFFNGRLGEVLFHSGHVAEAVPYMERALEICRATHDEEGVAVYLGNLAEASRYLGETERSIALLEQQRSQWLTLNRSDAVSDVTSRLEQLRAGEPPCRVVCRQGDRTYELAELRPAKDVHYNFEFVRNRPQLQKATALTRLASEKASAGEQAEAIELFQAASEVDPYDPVPHYQGGAALMDLGAYAAAAESFAEVERLAPGWFRCRTDRWLAEQIASDKLPAETWAVLRGLEDCGLPAEEVEQVCRRAIDRFPQFAPLWLILGDCLRNRQASQEAQAAYRRGLQCAEEPDVESRLLCALAGILPPESAERYALVDRALQPKGSLVAQAMACFLKKL